MRKYLLLFTALLALLSCEKNKNDGQGPEKDTQRIKEAIYDYEGENGDMRTAFFYEDDKLSLVVEYKKDNQGAWEEDYRGEFTYNGNLATVTWYIPSEDSFKPVSKNQYMIENGKITEELNLDLKQDQWIEDWKYTYQYAGENLISWQSYNDNISGMLEQDGKGEYVYDNGLVIEYKGFEKNASGNWEQDDRETFSYSEKEITGWIDYDSDGSGNWLASYKCEYTYTGDNITAASYFDWDNGIGNWEVEPYWEFYLYDNEGYLTARNNDDGDKVLIEYEEGNGNASLFWFYPEDLPYGRPTFKSATQQDKFLPYFKRISPGMIRIP